MHLRISSCRPPLRHLCRPFLPPPNSRSNALFASDEILRLQLPSKDRPRELSLELLKEASQLGVNLYEEHQRFVKTFEPRWRTDENVMLLLSAIALFSPNRANVLHKDAVKLEQVSDCRALRRYEHTREHSLRSSNIDLQLFRLFASPSLDALPNACSYF